jgi:hypothetical protein
VDKQQHVMKKLVIREMRELKLQDVRVQQKTELYRLTSIMQNIKLASIDFDESQFSIDFKSGKNTTDLSSCEEDFEVELRITGAQVAFSFG